jgi:predicted CXXCH cytochrome family protein
MKLRYIPSILLAGTVCALFVLSSGSAQDMFKLKTGAGGEICLGCHEGFQEKINKPFVHTPLTEGDCVGCHNPHTSSFTMLLSAPGGSICSTCHDSVIPEDAESVHQVVAGGECIACHDPHASDNESNLLQKGNELCAECHKALADTINENKYTHPPVREDCLGCHNAHASSKNVSLLKDEPTALCLECHETDKETFRKLHMDYPVEKGSCTSCHNPHGSNTAAMLYDNVHDPVARRNCNRCHVEPSLADPFQLIAEGYETCQACHYDLITESLNHTKIHWPLVDRKGCMNCHSPHASPENKLLREPMLALCANCHADTVARQERSTTPHPPIVEGECGVCHSPHSSDNQFILKEDSLIDLCADCHEWQTHTTHPIGEEIVDPRNKNLYLDCASCHRTHGTEHKSFIYFSTVNELCVQCHVRFRR